MIKQSKLAGLVVGMTFAGAMTASAATFFSTIGGEASVLPGNYSLPEPAIGTPVTAYTNGTGSVDMEGIGLFLSKASKLVFTYLGEDAGFENASFALGGTELFKNFGPDKSVVGDKVKLYGTPGLLDLVFTTSGGGGGSITNGSGEGSPKLSLAFAITGGGKHAWAFFDDGGRGEEPGSGIDLDYDDLAYKISAVPVPAGGLLLISGLGALVVARRRKQA